MRVSVDEDLKICPDGHYMEFRAGDIVEGPLAAWFADVSGCPVTVIEDETDSENDGSVSEETPAPAEETPAEDADGVSEDQEPEPDGALSADLAAASTAAVAPKAAGKSGAKGK